MSPPATGLPPLDEHATVVAAGPEAIWDALLETLDRAFSRPGAAAYARLVGCADDRGSGPRPLTEGSAVPGFRVASTSPTTQLVLAGSHRFSTYELIFRIDPLGAGRSKLTAESRATFPGVAGRIYRLLVLGTGGHVIGVRRLLSAVRRAARPTAARSP